MGIKAPGVRLVADGDAEFVSDTNPLPVTNVAGTDSDFFVAVSRGDVSGYSSAIIDGKVEDLDTADGLIHIWSGHVVQNDWNGPLSTAETMEVVSDSANDTSAGTGTQTVVLSGLDGNYEEITEVVSTNGTSAVTTTNSFVIIHKAVSINVGSGMTNAGNITITSSTTGDVEAYIPAGEGLARNGFYMVPAGQNAIVVGDIIFNAAKVSGGGGSPEVECDVFVQQFGKSRNLWLPLEIDTAVTNEVFIPQPLQTTVFPEKTTIRFEASTDVNNTKVRARMHLLKWTTS